MLDKPISALADTVTKYNLDPGTCVSALFWQANRSRMPDGPFPNMVGSEKFLMTALTGYLNVPREAVLAAASVAAAKSRIELALAGELTGPHWAVPTRPRMFEGTPLMT